MNNKYSKSKVYSLSDEEFICLIQKSNSYSECLRQIGLKTVGGYSSTILKRRIKELGCDVSHFYYPSKISDNMFSLSEILVKDSTYKSMSALKRRLIKENVIEYKCAKCGINTWNGKVLSLQLHHKNGVRTDHRINNLELLCPNCHSMTNTYAGKNSSRKKGRHCKECGKTITPHATLCKNCSNKKRKRKIERPTKEQLERELNETNFCQVAKKYGVTDNAVRKWCKAYSMSTRSKDYK